MRVRRYAAGVLALAAMAAPAAAQEEVNVRRSVSASGPLEVHLVSGEVNLVGWNRNELQVTGELASGAERVEVTTSGGRTVIRVHHAGSRHRSRDATELEIHYPARKPLQVHTVSADVQVSSASGPVRVMTVSGEVQVDGDVPELEVKSRTGDIQVAGETGRLSVETATGDVQIGATVREANVSSVSGEVHLNAAVGTLHASTVSGGIVASRVNAVTSARSVSGEIEIVARSLSGQFQTVSGTINLSGAPVAGRSLDANTHSGEVNLRLPRNASADVDISTFSGDIDVDIDGAVLQASSRRGRLVRVGRGGPRVQIRTFSGSVTLTEQ